MKKILAAAACSALGAALALPAAYAAPSASPAPCQDIVPGSTASYASVFTEARLVDDGNPLTEKTLEQRQIVGGGLLTVSMKLAHKSCESTSYVLSVYSPLNDARDRLQLIETYAVQGNGEDDVLTLETLVNDLPSTTPTGSPDPRACVKLLLSTLDEGGRTVDQAEDAGPRTVCKDGGGATSYGG